MTQEDKRNISKTLKNNWHKYLDALCDKNKDGNLTIVDVLNAYSLGSDTVLLSIGLINKIGDSYVDYYDTER